MPSPSRFSHAENHEVQSDSDRSNEIHRNVWNHDLRQADFAAFNSNPQNDTAQQHLNGAQIDESGINFYPHGGTGDHRHWHCHGNDNAGGQSNISDQTGTPSDSTKLGNDYGKAMKDLLQTVQDHLAGKDITDDLKALQQDLAACNQDLQRPAGSTNGGDSCGQNPGADGNITPAPGNDGGQTQNPTGTPGDGGKTQPGDTGGTDTPPPSGDGGVTSSPTPATDAHVKEALANAAGPNNNPHIVSVKNDGELQNAVQNAKPGDVIQLASGTYSPVSINNSGEAGAPITIEAAPGAHATIDVNHNGPDYGPGMAGVLVNGNYIAVRGLEITDSHYDANSDTTPTVNGNGIMIGSGYGSANQHNITIENNWVHNLPGTGIGDNHGDNVAIVGNTIDHTSRLSPYGVSGISCWELNDSDGRSGQTGIYILNNVVHDNFQVVPSTAIGANQITDGNGIIMDTNQGYDKWTLIEGNYVYDNGRGIHAFMSPYVRIEGNTSINNNKASWGLDNIDNTDPTDVIGSNTTS